MTTETLLSTSTIPAEQPISQDLPKVEVQQEAPVAPKVESKSLIDLLSDELKGEKAFSDFKDINGLAKSYLNAQKMIGSSIRIPSEEAGQEAFEEFYKKLENVKGVMRTPDTNNPEAMKDFYAKLGRPASPEQYRLEISEAEAETLGLKSDLTEFKKFSHDMGLTNDQANALFKTRVEQQIKHIEQQNYSRAESEKVLKEKWGSDFDTRLQGAQAAIKYLSEQHPKEVQSLLNGEGGNNPLLISILSEYGRNLSESGTLKNKASLRYGTSKEEALNILNDISSNKNHLVYSKPGTPGREEALAERARLAAIAYGE